MYFSHLLESDFAVTTDKHTHPYNGYTLSLHTQVTLSKSRSETVTMPMICSLIEHGFLPVFSI